MPVASTLATCGLLDDHCTCLVMVCIEPSVYVPIAVSGIVCPILKLGGLPTPLGGVRVMRVRVMLMRVKVTEDVPVARAMTPYDPAIVFAVGVMFACPPVIFAATGLAMMPAPSLDP